METLEQVSFQQSSRPLLLVVFAFNDRLSQSGLPGTQFYRRAKAHQKITTLRSFTTFTLFCAIQMGLLLHGLPLIQGDAQKPFSLLHLALSPEVSLLPCLKSEAAFGDLFGKY